jgi:hypothetical protein
MHMADVHVHPSGTVGSTDGSDTGAALLIFTLIVILAVAAFAFFAFNGTLFRNADTNPGTDINVEVPNPTPVTNPGATTAP